MAGIHEDHRHGQFIHFLKRTVVRLLARIALQQELCTAFMDNPMKLVVSPTAIINRVKPSLVAVIHSWINFYQRQPRRELLWVNRLTQEIFIFLAHGNYTVKYTCKWMYCLLSYIHEIIVAREWAQVLIRHSALPCTLLLNTLNNFHNFGSRAPDTVALSKSLFEISPSNLLLVVLKASNSLGQVHVVLSKKLWMSL